MSLPSRASVVVAVLALLAGCGAPTKSSDLTLLDPPSGVTVTELASGNLTIAWRDNSTDEQGFELVRSTDGASGTFTALASVGAGIATYQDTQVAAPAQYCYKVRAVGATGTTPSAYAAAACFQATSPAAPSGLASVPTFGQVDLSWTDNADDETAFEIWRSTTGATGTFALEASVGANVTAYNSTSLADGMEYCHRVRAVGKKGRTSDFSSTVCATTPIPVVPPPAAPTGLAATASSVSTIALSWTDHASDEQGFEIWRSTTGAAGTYTLLQAVAANVESFNNTGLTDATQYCYEVRATGAAGVPPSDFSSSACATTPPAPPATPTNLLATAAMSTRIDLSWQDNADDEAQYEIRRSTTGSGGTYALLATIPANSVGYSDLGLTSNTQYCYKVRATGAGGAPDSPFAGPSCDTTPVPTVVRIVLFGDSNTDRCEELPSGSRLSSYVSVAPSLAPTDPHMACSVPGKVQASWEGMRAEPIRVVNHAIASTTTGGGSGGGADRTAQGAPNARTVVNNNTRFRGEVLGKGKPWSGGEPTNSSFPNGPVLRVNAFTPGAHDFAYVSMGTNDDAGPTRTLTAQQTADNLRYMINQWTIAGQSADHFILTTLPPRDDANSPTSIPDRNTLIRALATELGVHLIDLAAHVSDDNGATWRNTSPSLNIGDGIHYTEAVRGWLGDQVATYMSSVTPPGL